MTEPSPSTGSGDRRGTPHDNGNLLHSLDYSVVQQCMHCGMCLPTCPTYDTTGKERNSPRGRISLMRAVADGELDISEAFADEMYYCLGCLACQTACPADVDYAHLFEMARAQIEREGVARKPARTFWRAVTIRGLFRYPHLLRAVGRLLWLYQKSGLDRALRKVRFFGLLPRRLRELEPQTPPICGRFSHQLIQPREEASQTRFTVGLLTGCVQDLAFSDINRDTADCLLANGCTVLTPPVQPCCGSLHAHNGDLDAARVLARRNIDLFDLETIDAIISNAGGCGSHLKHYGRLLKDDPDYADKGKRWDAKVKDIHEWLVEIGFRSPRAKLETAVTYHESCHLCHGQKITRQPREILKSIPGLELRELPESSWCCGSAGIYNITQPEEAGRLQDRKVTHLRGTDASIATTANPGCHLQLINGLRAEGADIEVRHPVSLLAAAYRKELSD